MSGLTDVVPWRYLTVAAVVLLLGVGVVLVGAWQLLVALLLLALLEVAVVVAALVKVARAVSNGDVDIDSDRVRAAVERVRRRLSV